MPFEGPPLDITAAQRSDLEDIVQSPSLPAGLVQRAKIVVLLADGVSYRRIAEKRDVSRPTVAKWKRRFLTHGIDGLDTHRPGRPATTLTARLRARILRATGRPPRDGTTHWSCRRLAQHLGISKDVVQRA